MANYTPLNLTTAVVGFATTQPVGVNTTFTVNNTIPTQENRDISFSETRPGWLIGRRPSQGQLFPRGIYNK